MEEALLSEIISIAIPNIARIILPFAFATSVYKYMKNKYTPLYYHSNIQSILLGISIVATIIYLITSFDFGDYSVIMARKLFPDAIELTVLINIIALLIRILISTIIDLLFCAVAWIFCKKKFLQNYN